MMEPCPSRAVLEGFADGTSNEAVAAHLGGCAVCRAAVEEARENNKFLAGVRTALEAHESKGSLTDGSPESSNPDMAGYEIQEELHRGGQGVVYRAVQTRTGRTVAIKVLLAGRGASGRHKERFEREIRIAAGLRHPNIVTVHDSGRLTDGRYGLVMEYIEGAPLDRWSRGLDGARGREARRAALRERLSVMVKVCDAVLCAHQHSIVHRDLKPANIIVDAAGEPHVVDFGIARDIGPAQHTRLTHTGEFAGTLAYASPEQVSGDLTKVDTRTDVYSLGVILYELVSGRMPYAVDGPMSQILRGIELAEPTPLPRRTGDPDGPWVDSEVSTIILKAMAKDPARRYQTAAGLRDDIGRYLAGEAIDARRDSTWYVLRKTAAKHRTVFAAAGLIFVILVAFGAAMAWQAQRLGVRGRELAAALSDSTIERGRMLGAAGDIPLAEAAVWPELFRAGVTQIDGPGAGFAGNPAALRAYWALWDISRRSSCLATLRTQGRPIELTFFDDNGRRLNAFDVSGRLVSWSVPTWKPVRETNLVPPIDGVTFQAALSPGGKIGIFGGGALRVMDIGTGALDVKVNDPDEEAVTGAFSSDGNLLATLGRDNRLRVRDARSLAIIVTIEGSIVGSASPWFCRPTFCMDGRLVAAACPGGSVGLWDASSGELMRTLQPPESLAQYILVGGVMARAIAFGTDGTIATSLGTHVLVWPPDEGPPRDLGGPFGHIRELAFVPGSEGQRLVSSGNTSGGNGVATIVWDLTTGKDVVTYKHSEEVLSCAISPDARLIAVGSSQGKVRMFETSTEPHVSVLHAGTGRGTVAALSPDGQIVALAAPAEGAAGWDVLLKDLKSGATISRFHREGSQIWSLAFAPDASSLFEGDADERITQRELANRTIVREFAFPNPVRPLKGQSFYLMSGINQMRLSPDGSILARARNEDGLIGLWDAKSGGWIDWLDSGTADTAIIDFSADSRTLVARHRETCVLWDVPTRRPKRSIAVSTMYPALRLSTDGAVIAHGSQGCIQFLDTESGRVLGENKDPKSSGMGMVFHRDGSVLFASAFDSSIRLWDIRTGNELLSLQKHATLVRSLVLTPDGNTLISADNAGTVLMWDLTYYNGHIRRELEYRAAHAAER